MQSSSWIRTQKFGCWKYKVAQTNSAIFDEQHLYTTTFDMIYVQAFIQALFYLQISEVEIQSPFEFQHSVLSGNYFFRLFM